MTKYNPEQLIHNYVNHTSSKEERIIVESWHIQDIKDTTYIPDKENITIVHKRMWNSIAQHIHYEEESIVNKKKWPRIAVAATLILLSSISLYVITHQKSDNKIPQLNLTQNDVAAAKNKATLTLNSGKIISLNEDSKNLNTTQGGVKIRNSNGLLIYDQSKNTQTTLAINKLETPRGGKYQLLLPDGTKVWLNSASILTYPSVFKDKERKVSLEGEAYFEVAKDREKTFKVISNSQTIEVLGTHFNVRAYKDEIETQTSLAEGKVKISNRLIYKTLKPGQAAITAKNLETIEIGKTDLEKDLAWKNNEFIFNGDHLSHIMGEVSRWYDVEVIYEGNFNKTEYWGAISRSKNILDVLNMLKSTGKINFKIEGRRITLMN